MVATGWEIDRNNATKIIKLLVAEKKKLSVAGKMISLDHFPRSAPHVPSPPAIRLALPV